MSSIYHESMERKCTNVTWLIFCIGFIITTLGFVGYTLYFSDFRRITMGYDDCGNICGLDNKDVTFDKCGSHDKTNETKVEVDGTDPPKFKCVFACPDTHHENFNRCWKNGTNKKMEIQLSGTFEKVSEDLINTWPDIAAVCMVSLVFSYILLILFRYAIKYVIWIIYIGFIIAGVVGAASLWYLFLSAAQTSYTLLGVATLVSALVFICVIFLCWYRKRIQLVAALFKEASRALIDIPSILFEPVLTFIMLIISFICFVVFAILIYTAGDLKEVPGPHFRAKFLKNTEMEVASYLNCIAFLWSTQFIFGCHHFVIAGTISKWYFARDKTKLFSPITTTFKHLINFHLGSVCVGSMLITLAKLINILVTAVNSKLKNTTNNWIKCLACCCSCLIDLIENLLKYLVRNAYIIVATEGTPFFTSATRAFDLLSTNLMEVIALNNVGDFILFVGRAFVVTIAGLVGYYRINQPNINYVFVPLGIAVFLAFLIAQCFISVFEMCVDTIFISFCIDYENNDGVINEYFMSPGLKKVLRKMKKVSGGTPFSFGHKEGLSRASSMDDLDEGQTMMVIEHQAYSIDPTQAGPSAARQAPPPPYPTH